jgi:hypothetical protein
LGVGNAARILWTTNCANSDSFDTSKCPSKSLDANGAVPVLTKKSGSSTISDFTVSDSTVLDPPVSDAEFISDSFLSLLRFIALASPSSAAVTTADEDSLQPRKQSSNTIVVLIFNSSFNNNST